MMAEGDIYSLPKRGYFVSEVKTFSEKKPERIEWMSDKPEEATYLADFISNRTSHDNFPFSIWAKLTREVLSGENSTLLLPPPAGGIMELRKAIADHLYQFRASAYLRADYYRGRNRIFIRITYSAFGNEAVYAIEDPGYQKIAQIYTSHGVNVCYIPMDAAVSVRRCWKFPERIFFIFLRPTIIRRGQ
ncbi:MAG: hypothetical protein ACLTSO_09310 [Coprococcus sp.]